jgi:hypothetical protein
LVTYISKKGTAGKVKKPPITIPKGELFKLGSAITVIKSATIVKDLC